MKYDFIFVAYDTGSHAYCPAIWADDKLHALQTLGKKVLLITSFASDLRSSDNLKVIKVPSVSLIDFRYEFSLSTPASLRRSGLYVFSPVAIVFGSAFDWIFKSLAGANSAGRYSWIIGATPVVRLAKLLSRDAVTFATGGASSGQLSAVLGSVGSRTKPTVEFQDPFIGNQMSMSPLAKKMMLALERFIVHKSKKVVFVTRQASKDAKLRHPGFADKITSIYPGARAFDLPKDPSGPGLARRSRIEIIHMGSLYGSRNLEKLFQSIELIYSRNPLMKGHISVINVGTVSPELLPSYLERRDFECLAPLPRLEALKRAEQADILLLVQHTDDRSVETIPYKTYDYLNLRKPIFGLVNSLELKNLVETAGGVSADNSSARDAADKLEKLVKDLMGSNKILTPLPPRIELEQQLTLALG
jgi:hypothetical protein